MSNEANKNHIAANVHKLLGTRGFTKHRFAFRRKLPEVTQLVTLQSSVGSTSAELTLTVNLGVIVPELLPQWASPTNVWSAQWRERIGWLMPIQTDHWWTVGSSADARRAAREIVQALDQFGIPKLDGLTTKVSLARLWRSGSSPGITEFERARYLKKIRTVK